MQEFGGTGVSDVFTEMRIRYRQNLFGRLVPQYPCWKRDRYRMGFEVTRRHIDDEALATASPDFLQLCRQHLDVPIRKKLGLSI